MPMVGRLIAIGIQLKARVRTRDIIIGVIPAIRSAEPFTPCGIIGFQPCRHTWFVLERWIDIALIAQGIQRLVQKKIEIAYILVYSAEERSIFADIHPLPGHTMRKTLHIGAPLLHRPYGVRLPMGIGDSRLRERKFQQGA